MDWDPWDGNMATRHFGTPVKHSVQLHDRHRRFNNKESSCLSDVSFDLKAYKHNDNACHFQEFEQVHFHIHHFGLGDRSTVDGICFVLKLTSF